MIEMERTGDSKDSIPVKGKKRRKTGKSNPIQLLQKKFYDELQFAEIEELHLAFDELVEQITDVGARFAKNPTAQLLKRYKSMIRDFLDHVTEHMYLVEHHHGGKFRQKVFTLTKVIDERLRALTELVMSQQAQNIDLLATLDEI
jgi:uncharacterized protein YaaR (DUF327 family)